MSASSGYEVLLDCSSLPPLVRASLQTFLERQPEVQSITRRLHVTDILLNPDTLGLVTPRFDLVVHLAGQPSPEGAIPEAGLQSSEKLRSGSNGCLPSVEVLDGLALQSIELGEPYESAIPSSSGTVPLFQ
jgi:hypothetical protein